MTKIEMIQILKEEISKESGIPLAEIEDSANFDSLGLDSIRCIYILDRLEKKIKKEINPIFFWDYPTIELFSEQLVKS